MTKSTNIQVLKWNSLTNAQKMAFGDRFIINSTNNLEAWCKPFNELSNLKKQRVFDNIMKVDVESLNYVI